mmetsp:Transcript_8583/g.17161  ORF Transcript_8583/g.17161 Transcript_8583/m.17161 type:complete len:126 (-) Transcript_8583:1271-1648(-)
MTGLTPIASISCTRKLENTQIHDTSTTKNNPRSLSLPTSPNASRRPMWVSLCRILSTLDAYCVHISCQNNNKYKICHKRERINSIMNAAAVGDYPSSCWYCWYSFASSSCSFSIFWYHAWSFYCL